MFQRYGLQGERFPGHRAGLQKSRESPYLSRSRNRGITIHLWRCEGIFYMLVSKISEIRLLDSPSHNGIGLILKLIFFFNSSSRFSIETNLLEPPFWIKVTGRSVFSRNVKHGIERKVVSSWIPPESVITKRQFLTRFIKSMYPKGSIIIIFVENTLILGWMGQTILVSICSSFFTIFCNSEIIDRVIYSLMIAFVVGSIAALSSYFYFCPGPENCSD